jgi:hypothetical protein
LGATIVAAAGLVAKWFSLEAGLVMKLGPVASLHLMWLPL